MKNCLWGFFLSFFWLGSACSCAVSPWPDGSVRLLAWNVENLFDDQSDGHEYPEFVPGASWNTSAFWERCQRIGDVLRALPDGGADLVALEEIENENTLRVLRERFLDGLGYRYFVMPPDSGTSVRVALLSRFPFVRTGVFYPRQGEDGEPSRAVLEAEVQTSAGVLVVLVNHWKSRQPDPQLTERSRANAAFVLNRRLEAHLGDPSFPLVVAVGDFNADVKLSSELEQPCLRPAQTKVSPPGADWLDVWTEASAAARSGQGWYDAWQGGSTIPGTYYYDGKWSRLDHVFAAAASLGRASRSVTAVPWGNKTLLNAQGTPRAWSLKDRKGGSDHLPLWVTISL
ncbi:MAG: endonuclease/exonuclease/phosphatase family protein [Spirochaetales bacterium]|nr:endonuclease/exonuclease/phosphatase family protein [Spirochaetales bacterium]